MVNLLLIKILSQFKFDNDRNSWNKFYCDVNETLIRETIDAIVSTGLNKKGYEYVNVDDCWQSSRNPNGTIMADPTTFPSGMKALADYAHSKGIKFGLYSSAGYYSIHRRYHIKNFDRSLTC